MRLSVRAWGRSENAGPENALSISNVDDGIFELAALRHVSPRAVSAASCSSSSGTAVPTGMKTTFVAVDADVSNMTSPLFHCTAMGLRGL